MTILFGPNMPTLREQLERQGIACAGGQADLWQADADAIDYLEQRALLGRSAVASARGKLHGRMREYLDHGEMEMTDEQKADIFFEGFKHAFEICSDENGAEGCMDDDGNASRKLSDYLFDEWVKAVPTECPPRPRTS